MMESTELLSENDKKEQLSRVYVAAIASAAGFVVSTPELDRDSVDVVVSSGGKRRASVGFQLKATSAADWDGAELKFQLKSKNFNDLVVLRQVPLLLLVMELPSDPHDWLDVSEDQLVLKRCAWWLSIVGQNETEQGSKQVRIPRANQLTVSAMKKLISQSESNDL